MMKMTRRLQPTETNACGQTDVNILDGFITVPLPQGLLQSKASYSISVAFFPPRISEKTTCPHVHNITFNFENFIRLEN
jgi:hypothetical protein